MAGAGLTPRQREVLDYIVSCIAGIDRPPTRHEIAERFGWSSPNAAEDHLRCLARKGAIQIHRGKARGIYVTGEWSA